MTAPADRVRRVAAHHAAPCRSRRGTDHWGTDRWGTDRIDSEFAAIVGRHREVDVATVAIPEAERCDGSTDAVAELRDRVLRIASALFCASGLDPQLLAFAVRRVAEHCAVDERRVADEVAVQVLRIAAAVSDGRPSESARPPDRVRAPEGTREAVSPQERDSL